MTMTAIMTNDVILRPTIEEDIDVLAEIVQNTWHSEDSAHHTTAELRFGAQYDVLWYLCRANISLTAELHGNPVGVVMLEIFKESQLALANADKIFESIENKASQTPSGRKLAQETQRDAQDTDALAAQAKEQTQAEIELFIVNAQTRGNGVGAKLFNQAKKLMSERGVEKYYLYTDSECDWQYYEHNGLTRVAENLDAVGIMGEPLEKYIYVGHTHQ